MSNKAHERRKAANHELPDWGAGARVCARCSKFGVTWHVMLDGDTGLSHLCEICAIEVALEYEDVEYVEYTE